MFDTVKTKLVTPAEVRTKLVTPAEVKTKLVTPAEVKPDLNTAILKFKNQYTIKYDEDNDYFTIEYCMTQKITNHILKMMTV